MTQAIIVAVGSAMGPFFGLALAPPDMGVGPWGPMEHAVLAWGLAAAGAIAGGLLFSWAKDK